MINYLCFNIDHHELSEIYIRYHGVSLIYRFQKFEARFHHTKSLWRVNSESKNKLILICHVLPGDCHDIGHVSHRWNLGDTRQKHHPSYVHCSRAAKLKIVEALDSGHASKRFLVCQISTHNCHKQNCEAFICTYQLNTSKQ